MKNIWFKLLIFMTILLLFVLIYKKMNSLKEYEGFIQKEKFVVKYDSKIYDDFYVEIYDKVNKTKNRLQNELSIIINLTQADYDNSRFLDIGSGTGYAVNELTELGFDAFGVDKSEAMIEFSEKKYPYARYKLGDVEEPMLFEKNTFTHILCLYYTIYQFQDKDYFFRNCYFWLQPGSYLIVHLVEPNKFNMAVPSAKHVLFGSPKRINDLRNKDSIVDFTHFQYKSSYKNTGVNHLLLTETFKDIETNNIRQNEQTIYMDKIQDIISSAVYNGFTLKSKVDLKSSTMDNFQYLYFFERLT